VSDLDLDLPADTDAADTADTAADTVARAALPAPTRTRWQPLRLGLTNLYRYDHQEFQFEDGRLLLRGNNGTGKSRVVALTLPFLLDGDTSPHRVEPDGDAAKRIEWNLLLGQHDDRLGYTWLEFGSRDEDGVHRFVTVGCGMRAVAGRGAPTKWFFVTPQRVGDDLSLVADTGQALTRERLREALAVGGGELFDTGTDYRRAVDRALFGLGETRYAALVDLLVQLRRPQLSRQLDEGLLSEALSEALPPLPAAVVADVAEAFRRLDDDRDEVDGFKSALAATARFLASYRTYAAVALRRRVRDVTTANSRYEDTRRRLNHEETRRDEQQALAAELSGDLTALDGRIDDADTTIAALEASPEMDLAREVDAARTRADELAGLAGDRRDDAAGATDELTDREQELGQVEAATHDSRQRTEQALTAAEDAAGDIGRGDEHRTALAAVTPHPNEDAVAGARGALAGLADQVDQQLDHLRAREDAVAEAAAELARARRVLTEREGRRDSAGDDLRDAEVAVTARRDELVDAYRTWSADLTELAPEPTGAVADALGAWAGEGPGPVAAAVTTATDVAVARLAARRRDLERERAALDEERASVAAERDAVAAGRHEPPAPHPARDVAGRATRPGAPLWQLVDWHDHVPADDRAGYESALEAAGLLDAWLTPDGRLVDADDAVLLADAAPAGGDGADLRRVLRPDLPADAPATVPAEVVTAVLAAVGDGADRGPTWVAADGRYRVGPLAGRFRRAEAAHVGHAAREAARRVRLDQLDRELAELADRATALEARGDELDARDARLDAERGAAPDEDALRAAHHDATSARRRLETLGAEVAAAEAEVAQVHEAHDAAVTARDRDATDLGLTDWVGRLDDLRRRVGRYRETLAGLWPQLAAHRTTLAGLQRAERDLAAAQATARRTAEAAAAATSAAREAATRRDTLQASVGQDVEAVLARLATAREERHGLQEQARRTGEQRSEAEVAARVAGERADDLAGRVEEDATARAGAVERLRHAVVAGLPEVADAALADVTAPDEPDAWAADPAVRAARRVDRRLAEVAADDDRWRRVAGDIFGHFQELEHALLPHQIQPTASHDDDLFVVSIPFQGVTRTVSALHALLADELDTRQSLLDAREREVLENHLVGEVATQLHELIRGGETLVAEMNAEIEARPNSTGMRLRFAWRPREDGPAAFADARRRLLAADDVWSPADREALGAFLQERIREVREADDTGTWTEHLARALDYRRWHLFLVERQQDGTWVRLTRRTHGTGSGGEKALALTIPQFAAAAAHYRSARPDAPRLVALDEAFVGIDSDMRAKCMDLLTRFELDVVMTSEREWGCYPTVPGLSIYQLSTRPGIDAVGVHRWVWNGRSRVAVTAGDGSHAAGSEP
jgi:uncharacterized protein (TIGR02680 family)